MMKCFSYHTRKCFVGILYVRTVQFYLFLINNCKEVTRCLDLTSHEANAYESVQEPFNREI